MLKTVEDLWNLTSLSLKASSKVDGTGAMGKVGKSHAM